MSNQGEVYYCGHCRRQQGTHDGERCKVCGRITVSWETNRESQQEAQRRWDNIHK